MGNWVVAHELGIRLAAFVAILAVLLAAERRWPRRRTPLRRALRWRANLPMAVISAVLVRIMLPLGAVGAAVWAQHKQIGLFHRVDLSAAVCVIAAFLALDLAIYWQHRLFHAVPFLWRLHRVHHSDVALDATSGVRFHPVEIVLSMAIKVGVVLALGAPAIAVVAFELALNGVTLFNHANLGLPERLEPHLRAWVVTPDMHRVHHSVDPAEREHNYAFSLPWWDHVFGTYLDAPAEGHSAMTIGLRELREDEDQRLVPLLLQPLKPL